MGTVFRRLAQFQPFGELANDLLSANVQHGSDLCHLTQRLFFVRDMPLLHVKNLQNTYMIANLVITR